MTKAAGLNMENNNRKLLRFKDAMIIVLLLGLAFVACLLRGRASEDAAVAVIARSDGVVGRISLSESGDYRFSEIQGMVFTVSEGKISVSESGCGDRTCVRTGAVSKSGEAVICVPNGVAVTIEKAGESDLDVVLR